MTNKEIVANLSAEISNEELDQKVTMKEAEKAEELLGIFFE